jgi:hypothetical protein
VPAVTDIFVADHPPPNRHKSRQSQIARKPAARRRFPAESIISPAAFYQPPHRLGDSSQTTTHSSQRHQSLRALGRASTICVA